MAPHRRLSSNDLALVKWSDGAYKGDMTHDVPTSWIHDFNASAPKFPESYAIEWRQGTRSKSGFPVFNGTVLDVSSDADYLKQRMQALRAQDEDRSSTSTQSPRQQEQSRSRDNSSIVEELLQRLQGDTPRSSGRAKTSTKERTEEKVCIGKSLWVSKQVYIISRNASSPGRTVRPLLRQAFSRSKLITHTYAGQKRKDGQKPALKKYQKMADIHAFVLERFPHLSQSAFGAVVNGFLGQKPNEIHEMEYVEDSDSETEL